jgi:Tfp pilus assembly PilM family ATPase
MSGEANGNDETDGSTEEEQRTRRGTLARFLALDWDQNQLHLISANLRGTTVHVQRASVWQEVHALTPATAEELGKALREQMRAAGISAAPVLGCLGRDRVIVKEVRFPSVPETEEPAIVRFQAAKELTDSLDEVIIDYVVTGGQPGGERKAAALVIRRDLLDTWQKFCQAAGLKLAALTPRLLGTSACIRKVIGTTVVTPPPEPPDGTIAVVVVGEKTAEISVLRGSSFLLARSLVAGANLAGEIRRNLAVHAGQAPNDPVRAIYVTGKGQGELCERLGELVEVPVHTFDPLAGAETLELPVGQRGTFAGAMGLLFARAEGELPANFVAPRQPRPPQNLNFRTIRLAVVASLAFLIGLVVLGRVLYASWEEELEGLKQTNKEYEDKLAKTRENAKRLKALDNWDTLVWLDEGYDLTARIPNVNTLRIKSLTAESLPRSPTSKFVAKLTITGELLDRRNRRKPLDELVTRFRKDVYYTPDPPRVDGDQFTLVVFVERRAPSAYSYVLKDVTDAERPKADAVPKMGAGKMGMGAGKMGAGKDGGGKGARIRGKQRRTEE